MKKIFNQLLPYLKYYKKHVILNVIFNILSALFTALSFVAIIPMLDVLFDKTQRVTKAPIWNGIGDLKNYSIDLLNFKVSNYLVDNNAQMALIIVIALVITTFTLKNLFGYFASQQVMYLKNNVLTDLRNDMYENIINLPLSFYSKRQKR